MSTTDSVWYTSAGLDISPYDEEPKKEYIQVHFGELKGSFRSLQSKKKRLTFEVSDIELALNYLENPPKEACIVYSQFLYKIESFFETIPIRSILFLFANWIIFFNSSVSPL